MEIKEKNLALNRWEMVCGLEILNSLPPSINLALTNRCNLACTMCIQGKGRGDEMELSDEVLNKVKPLFPYIYDINLTGGGENFLYPRFFDIVDLIKGYNVYTITSTNGILIEKEKARRLVLSRFGLLTISIDGATKETYEGIRKGANFDKLVNNIKRINFFKKGYRIWRPNLRFHFVAMRGNIEELPLLIELAHTLNVGEVSVAYLTVYLEELENQSLFFYKELSDRIMISSEEKGESLGIKVSLPPLFRDGRRKGGRGICKWPWGYVVISIKGKVYPCCASSMEMGDLGEDVFGTIWNNDRYRDLRKRVNTDDPPPECRHCGHHQTLDPNDPKSHFRY